MNDIQYVIDEKDDGKTIGSILKNVLKLSTRLIKKLKYSDSITMNGKVAWTIDRVHTGDLLVLLFPEETSGLEHQEGPLDIVYEDGALLVVNKAPGVVVHPTSHHASQTLANYVLHYLSEKGEISKTRPVNRLDRDTTGLVVFAKNQYSQEFLSRQMHTKTFHKEYLGVVWGIPHLPEGTVNLPIGRKEGSIVERTVTEEGQEAVTHYKTITMFKDAAMVRFILETGRTHQIRVHAKAAGFPLIGDTLYGDEGCPYNPYIGRQALHCSKMAFINPLTSCEQTVQAPLPDDMKTLLERLGQSAATP